MTTNVNIHFYPAFTIISVTKVAQQWSCVSNDVGVYRKQDGIVVYLF